MVWRADPSRRWALLARRLSRSHIGERRDGVSLVELLLGLGILVTMTAMAIPLLLTFQRDATALAAAQYVATRAALARSQAARRGAAVGIRFEKGGVDYQFRTYVDGNDNGIRGTDIAAGIDTPVNPPERLSDRFPAVRFTLSSSVPAVGASRASGNGYDPIRLGAGRTLTFRPLGTATSGTLYVSGPSANQYAIRILGTTGRIRILRFEPETSAWVNQ